MVLTDRQRTDLHAGIYEYLLSRPGEWFATAAEALEKADPVACEQKKKKGGLSSSSSTSTSPLKPSSSNAPVLEKKWTAVPRLQKKVLELERALSSVSALGTNGIVSDEGGGTTTGTSDRRNIPRPPSTLTLSGHTNVVTSVSLHPSYSLLASGSDDGSVKLWDVESGDLLKTLRGHINTVTHVSFDDSIPYSSASSRVHNSIVCRMLASCSTDLSIKLWTLKEGNAISDWVCTKTMRGHDHTVSSIAFVPNTAGYRNVQSSNNGGGGDPTSNVSSSYLVSASRDASIRVWEVSTGACIQVFSESSDWVRCLALTGVIPLTYLSSGSHGVVMASGCNDSSITLWTLIEENVTSGDGTTGSRGLISNEIGSTRSDKRSNSSSFAVLRGHDHVVECLSFVKPSHHSSLSSNAASKISQQLSRGSKGESEGIGTTSSSFLNKAGYNIHNLLVSGSRDKAVKIWNITTQECLMTFNVHENWVRSVILHPSGNYIISAGDDRSIRVLDLKSRRCLRSITEAHTHFVTSLAMHRSLPVLVSGGVDQVINCWALD